MRIRLFIALSTAAALAFAAPSALADTVSSANWAGYAVHRAGIRFTRVLGSWTQPSATCSRGYQTYSAEWVGLGGYDASSDALEQIGSEVDCTISGRVSSTAWYELVPSPSRPINMRVRPGDRMLASVTVAGNRVVLSLQDVTTHRSFRRTFHPSAIDVSSAEWILEAPSECVSAGGCQTLPLANFRSASFGLAQAQAAGGHVGTILDPLWDWTKIRLTPGGRQFVVFNGSGPSAGAAIPSALNATGSAFSVSYATVSVQGNPTYARRASVARAGYIVHPGR